MNKLSDEDVTKLLTKQGEMIDLVYKIQSTSFTEADQLLLIGIVEHGMETSWDALQLLLDSTKLTSQGDINNRLISAMGALAVEVQRLGGVQNDESVLDAATRILQGQSSTRENEDGIA